jgi:DNA-binding transcriptional LysR family regulator
MNLRQIETLRALMRHQNVSRAAADLGVSQPAVSAALKHMETQLGFLLFDRIGNRLAPREEAKILFRTSEPLHRLHRTVNQVIEDLRENKTGHVSVMATPPLTFPER